MIRMVFCFLLLVLDLLLKPGRGHRRSWKALEGPQNCTQQEGGNTQQCVRRAVSSALLLLYGWVNLTQDSRLNAVVPTLDSLACRSIKLPVNP